MSGIISNLSTAPPHVTMTLFVVFFPDAFFLVINLCMGQVSTNSIEWNYSKYICFALEPEGCRQWRMFIHTSRPIVIKSIKTFCKFRQTDKIHPQPKSKCLFLPHFASFPYADKDIMLYAYKYTESFVPHWRLKSMTYSKYPMPIKQRLGNN